MTMALIVLFSLQLKNQVALLMEKVNRYDNLEERVTQLMQLIQN